MKERKSNLELLRIVSMLFIIIYHILIHGLVFETINNKSVEIILRFIEFIVIVHVNAYVMISGYFQSQSKFKQSKLWQIINSSLFYKVAILIIMVLFGTKVSKIDILKECFILNLSEYWFIKVYFFLYCLSPFINKMIEGLSKKEYKVLLVVGTLLFSVIPYITGGQAFDNNGYTLYNFVYIYCIGGYLRRYPLEKSYFFKRFSINLTRIILFLIFISSATINFLIYNTSLSLMNLNSLFYEIGNNVAGMALAYSNPLIIIQTIALFSLFSTLEFKSKFINIVASSTLGVYLIHDNNYIRKVLYKFFNINKISTSSYRFIIYLLVLALGIFIACSIIELIRQLIFKFIYKQKFSESVRNKYYTYIKSIIPNS